MQLQDSRLNINGLSPIRAPHLQPYKMQLEATALEVEERSAYGLAGDRAVSEPFRLAVAVTAAMPD